MSLLNQPMTRRAVVGATVAVLAMPALQVVARQESSPSAGASLLDGLGLPVLEVTVSVDGIEAPAEIAAGPVLLVAHNETDGLLLVDPAQLPDEATVDDFLALSDDDSGTLPDWVADVVAAGAAIAMPGETGSIVVNLAAGEWTLIADAETELAVTSVPLTVTGDRAEAGAITADLDLELGEYVFTFPETLNAGPQIWHVTNTHSMPHHAVVFPVDRAYTADEVADGVMGMFSGTPVADGFSFETSVMGPPVEVPVISAGQEVWVEVDLAPGYYVAICFISDPGGDMPHLFAGMIGTFEVPGT